MSGTEGNNTVGDRNGKTDVELPETKLEVVEVIQIPDHVNFSRFFKDKVYNIKRTVRKPIKIIYSPVGHEVKSLTIFGNEEAAVNEVKMKIGSLVSSFVRGPKDSLARKPFRKELTHFISIPFNYPEIQDSLKLFKRKVQQLCPELEESLFQNPERMHLTAGVMNLSREQEEEAKLVLNLVKDEVINRIVGSSGQMKVTLQGVSFLGDDRNPNPAKTKVLYAKVTSEHLQAVADSVVRLFMDKKVMDPKLQSSKDGTVKLHVTLMNSTFRTREFERERGKLPRGTKRPDRFFDSSRILEHFKDFVFAKDVIVDQIHLSCFKSNQIKTDDGFYCALEKLKL